MTVRIGYLKDLTEVLWRRTNPCVAQYYRELDIEWLEASFPESRSLTISNNKFSSMKKG